MALTFNGKERDCEKIETIHGSHEKWSIQELIERHLVHESHLSIKVYVPVIVKDRLGSGVWRKR